MPDNPLAGIQQVREVAEVVRTYEVLLGCMTLRVDILRYFHLPEGQEYMAVPSHALVLDDPEFPYCPLRNYGNEREALRDLILEFSCRIQAEWGPEHWVPYQT